MNLNRLTRQLYISLTLLSCLLSSSLFAQAEAGDPVSLVTYTTNKIYQEVDSNFEKYKSDPTALQALVRSELMPLLDSVYSARLILGRAGRGIEKAKVTEFADAMSNRLVVRYSSGLLQFRSAEPIMVLPQRGELNEKLTRVRTRVNLPSGGQAPVDYAFHKTAEGWKAFDVMVEGISYVTTFRNQIMPDVQKNGIDSVIERLTSGDLELAD
jgi:phospholipid transport system substrate-binding protein